MTYLKISHPNGKEEDVETDDSFGTLENMFPDAEIIGAFGHYLIEELGVTADEYTP